LQLFPDARRMRAHHGARNPLERDDPKGRPSGILSEQYNHLRAKSPPTRALCVIILNI